MCPNRGKMDVMHSWIWHAPLTVVVVLESFDNHDLRQVVVSLVHTRVHALASVKTDT
jgi:hypothetical protein